MRQKLKRVILGGLLLLGLVVLAEMWAYSGNKGEKRPSLVFDVTFIQYGSRVDLEVRNATATLVTNVEVLSGQKQMPPLRKITQSPNPDGSFTRVAVAVDSPLALKRYEYAVLPMTRSEAKHELTIVFYVGGNKQTERHSGLD